MKKLLVVYNTCGISGNTNNAYYIDSIRSLLSQTAFHKWGDDYKIAVSGCMMHEGVKNAFSQLFGNHISCNFIDENLPLSVTFNDTVDKCVELYGEFDGYLYVDSGISFWDPSRRYDAIEILYDVFKSGPYAICAAMPSNDDGSSWWGIQYKENEDYIFPVGKCTNMHAQIFSNEWRRTYKRILPDIFASNCMESTFSNMCAAIKQNYIITQKIHLLHNHSMDGASIGSRQYDDDRMPMSSIFQTSGMLFKTKKDMDARYEEGREFGFGFEECSEYWRHDPDKFENNYAKDERLKEFLARELFLNKEEFNYDNIQRMFIPGK